jgi:hypothetical protein
MSHSTLGSKEAVVRRAQFWLSGALAAAAALAGGLTLYLPDVLHGPAAMNGSARGTALVLLVAGVPALVVAMTLTARGSARASVVWLGTLGYVLYNAVLFLFATPYNRLFLLYVAMLSLSIWSVIVLLHGIDRRALKERMAGLPARALACYVWVIAAFNALAWLRGIVPGLRSNDTPSFMDGMGVATNPVYVQDLSFWIPLMVVSALWLWRRREWGYLLVGTILTMLVPESASIAVDQWLGHQADPQSTVVSARMVPAFAGLAVLGLIPLVTYLRHLPAPSAGEPRVRQAAGVRVEQQHLAR